MKNLLQRTQIDPLATIEFTPQREGILCGIPQIVTQLRVVTKHALQIWALEEGAALVRGEVALRVRGRFAEYADNINALTGVLAVSSGWATGARALAQAAQPIPVIVSPAQTLYPDTFTQFEYAAVTGGCVAFDSPWQRGLISRALILLMGDTVRAAHALDQSLPLDVPRLVYVDTYHDDADEAVRVALALGDKLSGVVMEHETERNIVSPDLLKRVRAQLDLAGFPRVKIFVGGDVTPDALELWKKEQAPADGYFAGETIAIAPPIPFRVELKESDSKPLARRGLTPGTTSNLRLKKVDVG